MTQNEAMHMSNEEAVQILKPMMNMMRDQHGCPISDAYFAIEKAIRALSTMPQWISVEERLPEKHENVLCCGARMKGVSKDA